MNPRIHRLVSCRTVFGGIVSSTQDAVLLVVRPYGSMRF